MVANRKNNDHLYNLQKALREQEESTKQLAAKADKIVRDKEKEIQSGQNISEIARENKEKREKTVNEFNTFKMDVKNALLENLLNGLFNDSLGLTASTLSEDTKLFNRSLISNFIMEEGTEEILDRMKSTSRFTSEMASIIESKAEEIMDSVDPDDPTTYTVDSEEQINFYENIDCKDDIKDLTDIIKMRVSRATEEFIEKNIADKMDIKDIMATTKDNIDSIRSGDQDTDEAIAKEATIRMKRAIAETAKRPHNIYEQMVINLTEQVLNNEALKEKFTVNKKLDMDSIVERANSFYTLLETVNTLKIKKLDEDEIMKLIGMK